MPVSCSLQPIAETLRHIAGVIASLRSVRFAPAARYWIQTVMISASLAANSSSTFFMYLSVSFWDESSPSLAISSGMPSFWAFLNAFNRVAAYIADADASRFGFAFDLLDQLFAALFGQRRNVQADVLAVVRRGQSDVRHQNGFFDCADQVLLPRLDQHRTCIGDGDAGHL